jgi:hypothetical protein
MKKGTSKRLAREELAELKSLAALPDRAIDTSDAPELLDWSGAKRGLFYRPVKQQLYGRDEGAALAMVALQHLLVMVSQKPDLSPSILRTLKRYGISTLTGAGTHVGGSIDGISTKASAQWWPRGSQTCRRIVQISRKICLVTRSKKPRPC